MMADVSGVWANTHITCECCGINYEQPVVHDDLGEEIILDIMINITVKAVFDSGVEIGRYLVGLCGKCTEMRPFPCPHWGDMKGEIS